MSSGVSSKRRTGEAEPPAAKRARGADQADEFVEDVVSAALADSADSDGGEDGAGSSAGAARSSAGAAPRKSSSSALGGAGAGAAAGAGAGSGSGGASGTALSKGVSAARYAVAKDATAVLRRVAALAEEGRTKAAASGSSDGRPRTLAELGIENAHEVGELTPDEVMDGIEAVLGDVTGSILAGEGFAFAVPSRSASHQRYVPELDRIVLMRDKDTVRSFTSVATVRKATIMTRAMGLIYDVLRKGIHITKRDLFYTDVKLFTDQKESDAVLDDVASMVGCTRTSLHVVASDKGIVVGRVSFRDDGDLIDCTRMGIGGKAIPPFIDRITDVASDAKFILLVEKEAAFMRIAEDRFYNKYPCIVITAKGQPDVATRLFLKKLKTELKLPVLGLVDSDPYGLKILSVYMSGSKAMSYDSASLTTPDIKWLGVRPSDLDKYKIPEQCRLPMTANDIKMGQELMAEDFIKANPAWVKELDLMCKMKVKAEIQALSSFDFQYLTHVYLPEKLKEGDWI